MAIDDNTTYGLTGAQVKDLAQRIQAGGGGGPTVVQTTGQSITDVMSQKAVTDALETAGEGLTTLSYGTSTWQDFINAYNDGKIVYCRASSNSNPATGSQTRMAFMAYINNPTTPTEVEFQYVRSVSTKTASQQTDQVFVYKLTSVSGGTWTVATRDMAAEVVAGTNMTSSYSNGTLTLNATQPTVNDSTVTVTNNGTSKGSFTTNQSAAGTVALDYPEITMTTTDPGEGSALAANNYIGVYGEDPIVLDYSLTETSTGAKWIDGKTIYKKTINFGALPNSTTKTVAHGISNFSEAVKLEGIAKSNANNYTSLPYVPASPSSLCDMSVNATSVNMTSPDDRSHWSGYVTIYYTKSS